MDGAQEREGWGLSVGFGSKVIAYGGLGAFGRRIFDELVMNILGGTGLVWVGIGIYTHRVEESEGALESIPLYLYVHTISFRLFSLLLSSF
jgi:hypothetical protein